MGLTFKPLTNHNKKDFEKQQKNEVLNNPRILTQEELYRSLPAQGNRNEPTKT